MKKPYCYEVGKTINEYKNHQEGVYFELSDEGAVLTVFFKNPTQEEIEQFQSGKDFEIRSLELRSLILITVKIGSLPWMDAPYDSRISQNLDISKLSEPEQGTGLGLTIMLVDAATGELKHIRLVGLSTRFTSELFASVKRQYAKSFSSTQFASDLKSIYETHPSDSLSRMSRNCCKIKGE